MKTITHLITTIDRGGAENQLLLLVKLQIKQGWEVRVIPLKGKLDLARSFEEVGANVEDFVFLKNPVLQFLKLRKYFRSNQTLIHAHLPRAELFGALCGGDNAFVFSRHNCETFLPNNPGIFSKFLSQFVERRALGGIAISQSVKEFLLKSKEIRDENRFCVIPYGYSLEELSERNTFAEKPVLIQKKDFLLGTVGRFVPQKDYPTLFRVFSMLRTRKSGAQLLIIGQGEQGEYLKCLAKELGIFEAICWVGTTANVELHLEQLDAFILCSKYEGFGLVLLEAMAVRVPIVASRNSAILEVLGSDHPGLADTGSSESFFSKLLLLEDPVVQQRILSYQDSRLELFSPQHMLLKIESFYQSVLQNP